MSRYIGEEIGGYRVIEPIGTGGMAKVFKAYQPSFDRFVALKVLPDHYAEDETYIQRFQQEAKIIARLEHKHILPVHDFGEDKGITYLAMRYLRGGTLKDVLKRAGGVLPLADTARIIGQIAEALDYAHAQGIIHRDVKPSNVMIDANGDAYLTDFGIAKVLEGTAHLTATGGAMGTPAYMSPEQGVGRKVDARSDVYSLGVMLYEMVTGRVPFEADTPFAVVLAHANEALPLPSSINPDVPEEVERIIFKALAKQPGDRYATAGQMANDLAQAAAGAQIDPAQSQHFADVAASLAQGRPSDEVTRDVRIAAKTRPRITRGVSPIVVGGVVALALVVIGGLALLVINAQQAATLDPTRALAIAAGATQTAQFFATQQRKEYLATSIQSGIEHGLTLTVVALTPTATPQPTATPTTSPGEQFAAPILAAIKDRAPVYSDNFDNPASGWPNGKLSDQTGWEEGEVGYKNGEYFIYAPAAKLRPQQPDRPTTCASGRLPGLVALTDMVLQIEGHATASGNGNWQVQFRLFGLGGGDSGVYFFHVSDSYVNLSKAVNRNVIILGQNNLSTPVTAKTKVTVIAQGKQFAVYADDHLVIFAEDPTYDPATQTPESGLNLTVCNNDTATPFEAHFDNLRIWDISDLTH